MDIDLLIDQLREIRRVHGRVNVDLESPDEDPVRYYGIDRVKHYTQVRAGGRDERGAGVD